jgi:hypothetical protein
MAPILFIEDKPCPTILVTANPYSAIGINLISKTGMIIDTKYGNTSKGCISSNILRIVLDSTPIMNWKDMRVVIASIIIKKIAKNNRVPSNQFQDLLKIFQGDNGSLKILRLQNYSNIIK